ncbi:hypothetical protein GCM10017778_29730 [Streptomyces vinaceus]|nr:hypothetical protein GCM10017778_29730 [Streptomyces vinaceus]
MALRFRTDVAEVQVRAVPAFLRSNYRREIRAVPGRVRTKGKERAACLRTALFHWNPLAADQPVPHLLRAQFGGGRARRRADLKGGAIPTFRPVHHLQANSSLIVEELFLKPGGRTVPPWEAET